MPRLAFISGGTFTQGAEQFLREHPVVVLSKPFDLDALSALVAQVRFCAAARHQVSRERGGFSSTAAGA